MKKWSKKFVSLSLALAMCLGFFSGVFAAPLSEESYTVVNANPSEEGIQVNGGFLNTGANGYIEGNVEGDEWYMGDAGNSISFTFTGTAIKVISSKNADLGIADIYIDDNLVASADLYHAEWIKQQVIYENNALSTGSHTIKVECSGRKNSDSSGSIVIVDAFSYVKGDSGENQEWITLDNTAPEISYTGNFNGVFDGTYQGNVTFYETATFEFKGTGIEIISSKNNDMGISEVYIDGILQGEIDYYNQSFIHQQSLFKKEGLENKKHSVEIKKTAKLNESAIPGAGGLVSIDCIKYLGVKESEADPDESKFVTVNAAAGNQGISTDGGFLNKGASGYIDGNIEGDEWYLSAGNSITFSFSGSRIKIIAGTNSDMGIANIYLDGQKVDEIDCYSSSWIKGNVLYDSGKLADQEHTVKMECSGNKNPLSTNNIIVCDAFQYVPTVIPENERITVDDSSNRVIYKGKTERLDNEKAIEGTETVFYNTASFSFDGSSVEVIGPKAPEYGKATVYIDGINCGEIDQYSQEHKTKEVLFVSDPLSADSHTIKIVSEEKSAVDAFIYLSITEKNGIYTINSDNEKFITYSEKPTYEQADGAIEGDIALLKDNTSAQLDFFGNYIKVTAQKKNGAGILDVYLDGEKVDTIDLSSEEEGIFTVFESKDLLNIPHTIKLISNKETAVDAFMYKKAEAKRVQDDDPEMVFSDGYWTGEFAGDDGLTTFIPSKGNATLQFTGVGVRIYAPINTNLGISEVYIDDVLVGSYSQYSDTWMHQQLMFAIEGLEPKQHTLKIVNTDTKEAVSQMTYCIVDYVEYDAYEVPSALAIKSVDVIDEKTVEVEVEDTSKRRIDGYDLKIQKGTNKSYLYDIAGAELKKVSDTVYRFVLPSEIGIGNYISVIGSRNFAGSSIVQYMPEDACRILSAELEGNAFIKLKAEYKEQTKISAADVIIEKSEGFHKRRALQEDEFTFQDDGNGSYSIALKTPLQNEDCIFISGRNMLYGQASVEFNSGKTVKLNDNDDRIIYNGNWKKAQKEGYYQNDFSFASQINAGFELVFSGTSVSLFGTVGPDEGYVDVILDGVLIERDLPLYRDTEALSEKFFEISGLEEGVHVITLQKVENPEGSSANDQSSIKIDAIEYTSNSAQTASYTLNGDWNIAKDESGSKGKDEKWYVYENYPFEQAAPILVPGNIYEAFPDYNGITWYAKQFNGYLITSFGDRVYLEFEGVQYSCDVYLNGQYLGSHEGSAVPFEFDVTDVIHLYGENFLAVSVFNPEGMCKTGSASNYGAFWDAGGIWQDVNLHVRPEVYIDNIYAKSNWKTGEVELAVTVENTSEEQREISLSAQYGETNGKALGSVGAKSFLSKPGSTTFTLTYKIEDFKLWDLDDPNLYYVQTQLKDKEKCHTVVEDHMGFRHFEVKDGYFYLNGDRLYLKMTHQNVYDPVLLQGTPRDMRYINKASKQLKDAGFNTIRMIGMEALPEQLDYCDEIGLLVYQESSQAWLGANNFIESVQDELIIRDRNHPSLVIWGLLNEIYATDSRVSQCREYLSRLRELDNDRVVFLDSGRFDHDYSTAGISNSGSKTWDVFLGLEGTDNAAVGDIHTYPQYPMNTAILDYILTAGEGGNPVLFSEAGTGAMFNPFAELKGLQQEGAAHDGNYPYTAWAKDLCDGLTEVYNQYGLDSLYDSPEGIPLDSIEVNKLQRLILINYIRANEQGNGYGVTSLSDSQGLGEGLLDNFRNWKEGYDELMLNAWAELRWDILLNNSNLNVESGSEMELKANLTTEDVLPPGEYTASFFITDEEGNTVMQLEDETFTVKSGADAPFAYYVLDQTAVADLSEGIYTLNCKLNADYECANSTMDFTVTDNSAIVKEGTKVTILGDITSSMRKVLASNKIELRQYDAQAQIDNEVILIGKNVPDDAQLWRGLYKKIASGAYAAFLDSSALGTDNNWFPSANKGKREVVPLTMALYHADHLALPNDVLFRGLETGIMDPAYYGEQLLVPRNYFTDLDEPDEMNILMLYSQGLPISGETITGTAMGTYNYYRGAFTINILDLCNETTSPAVGRLILNIVNYGLEKSEAYAPIEDQEAFEQVLDSYNFKEDKVNMPKATIVDRQNRQVKLVFDEPVRILQECIYLSESPNPERYQSQAGASMEMVDAQTIDGQNYATTFILTFPQVNNLFTNSPYEDTGIPLGAGCRFLEYGADPEGANGKTPNVVAPDGRQMKMNYVDGDSDIGFIKITVEPESLRIRTAGNLEKIPAGTEIDLIAEFTPQDTTDTQVQWSVKEITGNADIDEFGRLTAFKAGTVEVTATSVANSEVTAKRVFEIYGSNVESISINGKAEILIGERAQYSAAILPEDAANKKIQWSVKNGSGEATISANGLLTGIREGDVTVVASSDDCAVDVKAEFKVVVKRASIGAKDFTIDGLALRPRVGDSGRYIVIVTPANSDDIPIFRSSDENIISVDEEGNWTAVKEGYAKIMVSVGDIVKVYDIQVVKDDDAKTDKPSGSGNAGDQESTGKDDSPKTGDNTRMTLFVGLCVTCLCIFAVIIVAAFRKRRTEARNRGRAK